MSGSSKPRPAWVRGYEGLLGTAERLFPDALFRVPGLAPRVVALTIDDGPSHRTSLLLDLLEAHHARATFFLHTDRFATVPDSLPLLDRLLAAGHEAANHMPDHRPSLHLATADFEAEFARAHAFLRHHGAHPRLFRPAGGCYAARMLPTLRRHGYFPRIILGSYLPWDTHLPLPEAYAAQLAAGAFPGAVLVLHDGEPSPGASPSRADRTVRALGTLLPRLRDQGYAVVPLGDLLQGPIPERRPRAFLPGLLVTPSRNICLKD